MKKEKKAIVYVNKTPSGAWNVEILFPKPNHYGVLRASS